MIRAISHALPVTSNTTRSSLARLCANRLEHFRARRDPARRSHLALPRRSRPRRSRGARPARSLSPLAPFVDITDDSGEPWANDTDGSALAAQPGQSQGRPPKCRARRPSSKAACPRCVLPKAPRTQCPDRNPRPGRSPRPYFHAPNWARLGRLGYVAEIRRRAAAKLWHDAPVISRLEAAMPLAMAALFVVYSRAGTSWERSPGRCFSRSLSPSRGGSSIGSREALHGPMLGVARRETASDATAGPR